MSALSGASWEDVRRLWRDRYSSLLVVTIAERGSGQRSFSADTDIAECLIVATKARLQGTERRATFVILNDQPTDTLRGEVLAEAVRKALAEGNIRRLEEGPYGGTRLTVGAAVCGEVIDCPLPADGSWPVTGISDLTLAQTVHQLSQGRLWIEGMPANPVVQVPVARIKDVVVRIGPHDLDITGAEVKSDGLPQGPFQKVGGCPPGAAYPALWNHDNTRERRLAVQPDSHCRVREVGGQVPAALQNRVEARWATATRAHYNRDLQFNSQSLIVAMTPARALGGRAWPTVVLEAASHEYAFALWCNSTLGLLCHWWTSNKSQSGRGSTTVSVIPDVLTLDVRALSAAQHERARAIFEELSLLRFLPFDQADEDPARATLDRRVIVDLLGFDPMLCDVGGPVDRLRQKLAAEPQIRADKATRVVFTATGEMAVQR